MLAYTTLGVTDFERAKAFYEALLGVIGAKYVFGNERIALYGTDVCKPDAGGVYPYDEGEPARGTAPWWPFALAPPRNVTPCTPKRLNSVPPVMAHQENGCRVLLRRIRPRPGWQ